MTTLMVWNVQNFTASKFHGLDGALKFNLIADSIFRQVTPDLLVVIEVNYRRQGGLFEGILLDADDTAGKACLELWKRLRPYTNCSLVPPVLLGTEGYGEGVAVYYNNQTLQFVGPYVRGNDTRANVNRACPLAFAANNVPVAYPPIWNGVLPSARQVPVIPNPPPNYPANIFENLLAGQWEFYPNANAGTLQAPNPRIFFPSPNNLGPVNAALSRSPYLTEFIDLSPGMGNRLLKLFSVHTSPGATAAQGVAQYANIAEANAGANEVVVFAGDFNVDSFSNFGGYASLTQAGFQILVDPMYLNAPNANRRPYCQTHLLPAANATPAPTTPYPSYGYMGVSIAGNISYDAAIDNAFVLYGGGAARPVNASSATILNPVVSSPYNQDPNAPPDVQGVIGTQALNPSALQTLQIPFGGINPVTPADLTEFQNQFNFGYVAGVSDHLPVLAVF